MNRIVLLKQGVMAMAASVLLVACGGGGGSSESAPPTPTPGEPAPEGFYNGISDVGATVKGVVLNNHEYYVLYGEDSGDVFTVYGIILGSGAATTDTFTSGNLKDFHFLNGNVLNGTMSANFVREQNLTGTVSYDGGTTLGFSAAYDAAYEQAPDLAEDAGTYMGTALNPAGETAATLNVASTGQLSGSDDTGCSFAGELSPRSSGDIYDLTITFAGVPCTYSHQTLHGIAYFQHGEAIAAATTPQRDGGVFFIGHPSNMAE